MSDDRTREIAKIRRADVAIEDHDILTFFLEFDGGSWGQGISPRALDKSPKLAEFIRALLEAVAVDSVSALAGKTVYVLRDQPYGPIVGIENLPTERGKKFLFSEVFPE